MRFRSHIVLAIAAMLGVACCAGAQVRSTLLTPAEISRIAPKLDRKQIPSFSAEMDIERKQSFRLAGPGFETFSMLPVGFDSTSKENKIPAPRCGVFIVPEAGAATFVPTLGHGWTEAETCNELDGVGFLAGKDHPYILLLYTGSSPNAVTSEPVILVWDAAAKHYVANQELSSKMPDHGMIPAMKAKLKALVQ
jgi:hypothetical protein